MIRAARRTTLARTPTALALLALLVGPGGCSDDRGDGSSADANSRSDTSAGRGDGAGGDGGASLGDGGSARDTAPDNDGGNRDPLAGIGKVTLVKGGFQFTEGPLWRSGDGVLLFSDVSASKIYRLKPPSTVTTFRGASNGANGLGTDRTGDLLACEHTARRLSVTRSGTVSSFVDRYQGKRFNSPNDVAVRKDGTVYFTDPPYGLGSRTRELTFNGVFRVAPDKSVSAEWKGSTASRPNGVVLSVDEKRLYLADTAKGEVMVFSVAHDGTLGTPSTFVRGTSNADGMAIDSRGNLFVSTASGVQVFSSSGKKWGTIKVPQQPANCGFGDADFKTLYITARTGLYRVRLPIAGKR